MSGRQQHWPNGYADQSAASPPPPRCLGTRSLLASPQIKTAMTTFANFHSKCSIISGRVLKKPHVKTYEFESALGTRLGYCARYMRLKKVIKYWKKNAGSPKHHLMGIKGTGKGGQAYMTGVMRSVDRLADHACKLNGLEFIKLFWSWKVLQSLSCYFQILMYFRSSCVFSTRC